MKLIAFDLEGPLAPQDNAYELMKALPDGGRLFQVISRYDDLLTLEGRQDYEPGETLALIVPFLAHHGVTEEQIAAMGQAAPLTPGARELVTKLVELGWGVFCISTSYERYATEVTRRLGIAREHLACTEFPLDPIRRSLGGEEPELLQWAEQEFVHLESDAAIKQTLDRFYRWQLPSTKAGKVSATVRPVGGRRKLGALRTFAIEVGRSLADWVAVGDSITDVRMVEGVDAAGGLGIAFNANEYLLPHATLGLASTRLDDLWPVLEAWEKGGREAVRELVAASEREGGSGDRGWLHWLADRTDIADVLELHTRTRRLVRREAAGLG